ncbi:hypothetical protein HAX54_038383 [Datura stramonium]|uniref:Uncharacterized protein n=1 Tax=Datura stramonium TaxID=4076 RepID=A0ABS8SI28_DATST|nr:hypothetical protein [Datura stramonium]
MARSVRKARESLEVGVVCFVVVIMEKNNEAEKGVVIRVVRRLSCSERKRGSIANMSFSRGISVRVDGVSSFGREKRRGKRRSGQGFCAAFRWEKRRERKNGAAVMATGDERRGERERGED